MKAVADCCFTQVMGRRLQTGNLRLPLLFDQVLDPTLQPCNRTLSTVGPVLKRLRLLKEFWLIAHLNHLRTKHAASGRTATSQKITSEQRLLRLLSRERKFSGRSG